jgi:hypothetical protein
LKNIQIAIEGLDKLKELAFAADTKDLCSVPDIAKAVFFSHYFGPLFNSTTFDFNGIATTLADEVMMVGISTEAIDSFTIITTQYIDNLVIH